MSCSTSAPSPGDATGVESAEGAQPAKPRITTRPQASARRDADLGLLVRQCFPTLHELGADLVRVARWSDSTCRIHRVGHSDGVGSFDHDTLTVRCGLQLVLKEVQGFTPCLGAGPEI